MAAKKFIVDDKTRTVYADFTKLEPGDFERLKMYKEFGYIVTSRKPRSTNGRNKAAYLHNLEVCDREIFEAIMEERGFSAAASFANYVIKLGQFTDKGIATKSDIETFREKARKDIVSARIWAVNKYPAIKIEKAKLKESGEKASSKKNAQSASSFNDDYEVTEEVA